MSSEIDYQRKAYSYKDQYGDMSYVVLHETGSSNCFDLSGKRSRSWRVLVEGSEYQVTRKICEYAGHSAGGLLRLNQMSRWHSDFTDPLRFIRAYNKALKSALPIEQVKECDKQFIDASRKEKNQMKKELPK